MSPEMLKEYKYRYEERLALLGVIGRPPTAEEKETCRVEAIQAVQNIYDREN